MADFPALPLWTDAYLSDTRHLSTLEHGAYLLLMMEAWRRPTCSIPNDDILLSRLCGLAITDWMGVKNTVLSFWVLDKRAKTWSQKRLSKEREYVSEKSAKQRERVAKRWNKKGSSDTAVIPNAIPDGYRGDTPTPTPTPTPSIKEKKDILSETSSDLPPKPKKVTDYPEEFEAFWRSYPRTPNMSKKEAFDEWKKLDLEERVSCAKAVPGYIAFLKMKPDLDAIHACRFISKKRFEGFTQDDQRALVAEDVWLKRLRYGRREKLWSTKDWGPAPGSSECKVPQNLIEIGDGEGWRELEVAA